jgi:hypothetical protein
MSLYHICIAHFGLLMTSCQNRAKVNIDSDMNSKRHDDKTEYLKWLVSYRTNPVYYTTPIPRRIQRCSTGKKNANRAQRSTRTPFRPWQDMRLSVVVSNWPFVEQVPDVKADMPEKKDCRMCHGKPPLRVPMIPDG